MSELINAEKSRASFQCNLLANVSILALLGTVSAPSVLAEPANADHPTVWIELGGQLERLDKPQAIFSPPFFDLASPGVWAPLVGAQRPSRYASGAEGKITLMPEGTNWVFSAAVRYGRVKNARHLHYQTAGQPSFFNTFTNKARRVAVKPVLREFGDGQAASAESHFVIDFQAGKDVGLGLFGSNGNSTFSAGVRYAQFTSRIDGTLRGRPILEYDVARYKVLGKYQTVHKAHKQSYTALVHATRSTHAIGPSVSWDGSMPVAGSDNGMMIDFDWDVNAAVLFGRQRVRESHNTVGYQLSYNSHGVKHVSSYNHATARPRSRSVIIPNVGGSAGVSLKFPNAKFSLGYRGDFFFNAADSGLDARDVANQNFYGPFATISIGMGN